MIFLVYQCKDVEYLNFGKEINAISSLLPQRYVRTVILPAVSALDLTNVAAILDFLVRRAEIVRCYQTARTVIVRSHWSVSACQGTLARCVKRVSIIYIMKSLSEHGVTQIRFSLSVPMCVKMFKTTLV
jgi:hypothetical protein